MEYTQNYALRKPGLNEYANVGDLNFNADKIDSQMKKHQDVDGEVYDPTTTSSNAYEAGDYVINPDDGLMYVCNGTAYGTWDATKWDHTTEFEEIQKAMASGGESELANLHDVEITNPTDGQALLYDDTTDKWHNSDLPDADVTKTASGNPIEFTDGADAPLVKCVTQITGSQDLHGYDKPWVGGAGKNKLPMTVNSIKGSNVSGGTWSGNTFNVANVDFTILTDNANNVVGIKVNGTANSIATFNVYNGATISFESETILNGCPSGGSTNSYLLRAWNGSTPVRNDGGSGATISANTDFTRIDIRIANGYTASNLVFYPMIRLATVTDPTFTPYSNICPITAYTEGEIEVRGKNLFDKNGNLLSNTYWNVNDNQGGSSSNYYLTDYIPVKGSSVVVSGFTRGYVGGSAGMGAFDANKNFIRSSANTTMDITEASFIRLSIGTSDLNTFQCEIGTQSTEYAPYTSTNHTTTWTPAIYQGTADFVGRIESHSKIKVVFDGSVDEDWQRSVTYNGNFYINLDTLVKMNEPFVCSVAPFVSVENYAFGKCTISNWSINIWIMPENTTMGQWRTYLSTNPIEIAVEIATPESNDISISNLPIKSLSSYNHIESSTGEMEVEYFPQKEQPLIDLIQSSQHVYSTQEQVVGKWVDGKDVYEKTYVFSSLPSVNDWTAFDDDCGIDTLVNYSLMFTRSNGQIDNDSDVLRVAYNPPNSLGDLCYYPGGVGETHIIVRYTKTSSNNRSLAKSAPQEETKEEPTEEVKEEVKEEETINPETNEEEKR